MRHGKTAASLWRAYAMSVRFLPAQRENRPGGRPRQGPDVLVEQAFGHQIGNKTIQTNGLCPIEGALNLSKS